MGKVWVKGQSLNDKRVKLHHIKYDETHFTNNNNNRLKITDLLIIKNYL